MKSLQKLEEESRKQSLAEQVEVSEESSEYPPKQTLMPSEKILKLLSILNKTRVKLRSIMASDVSVEERSNKLENVADTVTELEEGTLCYWPVACLTHLFEGLWRRIEAERQEY